MSHVDPAHAGSSESGQDLLPAHGVDSLVGRRSCIASGGRRRSLPAAQGSTGSAGSAGFARRSSTAILGARPQTSPFDLFWSGNYLARNAGRSGLAIRSSEQENQKPGVPPESIRL